jgi:hypothetical protein
MGGRTFASFYLFYFPTLENLPLLTWSVYYELRPYKVEGGMISEF